MPAPVAVLHYPEEFPRRPRREGFSHRSTNPIQQFEPEDGPPISYSVTTTSTDFFALQYLYRHLDTAEEFIRWWREEARGQWFLGPDPTEPTREAVLRISGTPTLTPFQNGLAWIVSVHMQRAAGQ